MYSGKYFRVELRLLILSIAFAAATASLSAGDIPSAYADPKNLTEVISKYQDAVHTQQEALRGAQMEVDIDASLPKLEKKGKLKVLRVISKLGKITFRQIGKPIGDGTVYKEVIQRYLQTEKEGRENGTMAISNANYNFKINAIINQDSQTTYIFDLKPKRKADGLFKGQLWLDGATGMPLKEIGELVKKPSVMLKSVKFERDYELHDGLSIVTRVESTVDVRLVGKAQLTASFSDPTWPILDQDSDDPVG